MSDSLHTFSASMHKNCRILFDIKSTVQTTSLRTVIQSCFFAIPVDSEIPFRPTTVYFHPQNPQTIFNITPTPRNLARMWRQISRCSPGTWGRETGHQQFSDQPAVHSARIFVYYLVSKRFFFSPSGTNDRRKPLAEDRDQACHIKGVSNVMDYIASSKTTVIFILTSREFTCTGIFVERDLEKFYFTCLRSSAVDQLRERIIHFCHILPYEKYYSKLSWIIEREFKKTVLH